MRMEDQIVLESIKMPSRYLNVSALRYQSGFDTGAYEVDLALNPTPFSLFPYYVPNENEVRMLKVTS